MKKYLIRLPNDTLYKGRYYGLMSIRRAVMKIYGKTVVNNAFIIFFIHEGKAISIKNKYNYNSNNIIKLYKNSPDFSTYLFEWPKNVFIEKK